MKVENISSVLSVRSNTDEKLLEEDSSYVNIPKENYSSLNLVESDSQSKQHRNEHRHSKNEPSLSAALANKRGTRLSLDTVIRTSRPSESDRSDRDTEAEMDNLGSATVRFRKPGRQIGTANFDYEAKEDDELSLKRGSVVEVIRDKCDEDGWIFAKVNNRKGMVPKNYIILLGSQPNNINSADITGATKHAQAIGEGGFARVFRGIYKGKDVALKIPKSQSNPGKELKTRETLEREALILCRLSHRNIVGFFGICQEPMMLVLELCEGGTLFNLCRKMRNSDVLTVIYWAKQVAEAINYLHTHNDPLIHADLKADNVLIKERPCDCWLSDDKWKIISNYNRENRCRKCNGTRIDLLTLKVTDFGLSRSLTSKRESFSGSTPWMSPEVIKSHQYSKKSDIWAFGVFLWETLSCKMPFSNYDFHVVLFAIVIKHETLPVPDNCPDELRVLFDSCWRQEPRERTNFARILEMLDFVEQKIDSNYRWNIETKKPEIKATFDEIQAEIKAGNKFNIPLPTIKGPATPQRSRKGDNRRLKVISKENISLPQGFRHNLSVRPTSQSPPRESAQQLFTIIYGNGYTRESGSPESLKKGKGCTENEPLFVRVPVVQKQNEESANATLPRNLIKTEGKHQFLNEDLIKKITNECCIRQFRPKKEALIVGLANRFGAIPKPSKSNPELVHCGLNTDQNTLESERGEVLKERMKRNAISPAGRKLKRMHDYVQLDQCYCTGSTCPHIQFREALESDEDDSTGNEEDESNKVKNRISEHFYAQTAALAWRGPVNSHANTAVGTGDVSDDGDKNRPSEDDHTDKQFAETMLETRTLGRTNAFRKRLNYPAHNESSSPTLQGKKENFEANRDSNSTLKAEEVAKTADATTNLLHTTDEPTPITVKSAPNNSVTEGATCECQGSKDNSVVDVDSSSRCSSFCFVNMNDELSSPITEPSFGEDYVQLTGGNSETNTTRTDFSTEQSGNSILLPLCSPESLSERHQRQKPENSTTDDVSSRQKKNICRKGRKVSTPCSNCPHSIWYVHEFERTEDCSTSDLESESTPRRRTPSNRKISDLFYKVTNIFGGGGGASSKHSQLFIGTCPHCDYQAEGTNEPDCPECGHRLRPPSIVQEAKCYHPHHDNDPTKCKVHACLQSSGAYDIMLSPMPGLPATSPLKQTHHSSTSNTSSTCGAKASMKLNDQAQRRHRTDSSHEKLQPTLLPVPLRSRPPSIGSLSINAIIPMQNSSSSNNYLISPNEPSSSKMQPSHPSQRSSNVFLSPDPNPVIHQRSLSSDAQPQKKPLSASELAKLFLAQENAFTADYSDTIIVNHSYIPIGNNVTKSQNSLTTISHKPLSPKIAFTMQAPSDNVEEPEWENHKVPPLPTTIPTSPKHIRPVKETKRPAPLPRKQPAISENSKSNSNLITKPLSTSRLSDLQPDIPTSKAPMLMKTDLLSPNNERCDTIVSEWLNQNNFEQCQQQQRRPTTLNLFPSIPQGSSTKNGEQNPMEAESSTTSGGATVSPMVKKYREGTPSPPPRLTLPFHQNICHGQIRQYEDDTAITIGKNMKTPKESSRSKGETITVFSSSPTTVPTSFTVVRSTRQTQTYPVQEMTREIVFVRPANEQLDMLVPTERPPPLPKYPPPRPPKMRDSAPTTASTTKARSKVPVIPLTILSNKQQQKNGKGKEARVGKSTYKPRTAAKR